MGTLFGLIAPSVEDMLDTDAGRQVIEQLGGAGTLEDTMLAAVLAVSGVLVTCFGLMVVARAAGDERDGRSELVLASPVSRAGVFWSAVAAAVAGVVWLLLVTGVTMGVSAGRGPGGLVPAALVQAPAAAVVVAGGAALWALRARWAQAGWGLLLGCLVLEAVDGLLDLPGWVLGVSPFAHVPRVPVEPVDPVASLVLAAVAVGVLAAGLASFRRRDLS
jgi:ABC-2 type transport system permease protein